MQAITADTAVAYTTTGAVYHHRQADMERSKACLLYTQQPVYTGDDCDVSKG